MLDLQAWKCFVAVAETGGVRSAALALGLEPSSVSRRVATLEQQLGVRLVQSAGRHVFLTVAGINALRRMKPIVETAEASIEAIRSDRALPQSVLHVVAPVGYTNEILRRAISVFSAQYPSVRLWLESWQYGSERFEDLGHGIDLIISTIERQNPSLQIELLSDHRHVVCASPAYLARHSPIATPLDLKGHFLAGNSQFITGQAFEHEGDGQTLAPDLDYQLISDNSHALIDWCAGGGGILVGIPFTVAAPYLKERRLAWVLPDWRLPNQFVYAYTTRAQYADPSTLLAELIRQIRRASDAVAAASDAVYARLRPLQ